MRSITDLEDIKKLVQEYWKALAVVISGTFAFTWWLFSTVNSIPSDEKIRSIANEAMTSKIQETVNRSISSRTNEVLDNSIGFGLADAKLHHLQTIRLFENKFLELAKRVNKIAAKNDLPPLRFSTINDTLFDIRQALAADLRKFYQSHYDISGEHSSMHVKNVKSDIMNQLIQHLDFQLTRSDTSYYRRLFEGDSLKDKQSFNKTIDTNRLPAGKTGLYIEEGYLASTTGSIGFRIERDNTPVNIKIYDTAAREVSTVVDDTLNKGTYRQAFNMDGRANGVYFVRMFTGERVIISQLTYLGN